MRTEIGLVTAGAIVPVVISVGFVFRRGRMSCFFYCALEWVGTVSVYARFEVMGIVMRIDNLTVYMGMSCYGAETVCYAYSGILKTFGIVFYCAYVITVYFECVYKRIVV